MGVVSKEIYIAEVIKLWEKDMSVGRNQGETDLAEEVMSCWKVFAKVKRTRQEIGPLGSAAKTKVCLRNQKFCLTLQEKQCRRRGLQADG